MLIGSFCYLFIFLASVARTQLVTKVNTPLMETQFGCQKVKNNVIIMNINSAHMNTVGLVFSVSTWSNLRWWTDCCYCSEVRVFNLHVVWCCNRLCSSSCFNPFSNVFMCTIVSFPI